jgi:hypothetical protein
MNYLRRIVILHTIGTVRTNRVALLSVGRTTGASSLGGVARRCHDGDTGRGYQPRGPLVSSCGAQNSAVGAEKLNKIPAVAVEIGTRENHPNRIDRRFDGAAARTGDTHRGDDVIGHNPIQARPASGRIRSKGPLSSLRWSKWWFGTTQGT